MEHILNQHLKIAEDIALGIHYPLVENGWELMEDSTYVKGNSIITSDKTFTYQDADTFIQSEVTPSVMVGKMGWYQIFIQRGDISILLIPCAAEFYVTFRYPELSLSYREEGGISFTDDNDSFPKSMTFFELYDRVGESTRTHLLRDWLPVAITKKIYRERGDW